MIRRILCVIAAVMFFYSEGITQQLPREFRGAWLTTFLNIDWPDRKQSTREQQDELIKILNEYQRSGINCVYMQVRSQCDAMYASTIEPWSADLTGTQGMAPFPLWDPLEFAVRESHKRGLEIHAWLNPYRAVANISNLPSFSPNHIARVHPEWLLASGTLRTLNPGLPEVRTYILRVIDDIVTRYDIDGIHFDDYFYPEGYVNDEETFSTYREASPDKATWRRDNVNTLIRSVSENIRKRKPWTKFGVSPSGIYRNSSDPAIGTPTRGLEHYSALFSDSRKWLEEKWIDYLIPQVYWHINQPGSPFDVITRWWHQIPTERHIYIGMGTYKVANGESAWFNPSQIPDQIRYNRKFPGSNGQSFYNTSSFLSNRLSVKDSVTALYSQKALVPSMPWISTAKPGPVNLSGQKTENGVLLSWTAAQNIEEISAAKYFAIYSATDKSFSDWKFVSMTVDTFFVSKDTAGFFGVMSMNRLFNEGDLSNIVSLKVKTTLVPVYVLNWKLNGSELALRWKDNAIDSVRTFQIEKSADGNTYTMLKSLDVDQPGLEYLVNDIVEANTWYRIKAVNNTGLFSTGRPLLISYKKQAVIGSASDVQIAGSDISVKILVAGEVVYRIFNDQRQATWGKIKTARSGVMIRLPETKLLPAGNYRLVLENGNDKQEMQITIR